jgi:hypothetical protein
VRLVCSSADRLGIIAVILRPSHKRLDILRADDPDPMVKSFKFSRAVKSTRARFDRYRAAIKPRHNLWKLITHHPTLATRLIVEEA